MKLFVILCSASPEIDTEALQMTSPPRRVLNNFCGKQCSSMYPQKGIARGEVWWIQRLVNAFSLNCRKVQQNNSIIEIFVQKIKYVLCTVWTSPILLTPRRAWSVVQCLLSGDKLFQKRNIPDSYHSFSQEKEPNNMFATQTLTFGQWIGHPWDKCVCFWNLKRQLCLLMTQSRWNWTSFVNHIRSQSKPETSILSIISLAKSFRCHSFGTGMAYRHWILYGNICNVFRRIQ